METVNDRAIPEEGDGAIALAECSARGELIVPTSEGQSDFEELRRCNLLQPPRMILESAGSRRAVLVVFDVLRIGDEDLRVAAIRAMQAIASAHRASSRHQNHRAHRVAREPQFRAIVDGDHEGVVAKRMDAPYRRDRTTRS